MEPFLDKQSIIALVTPLTEKGEIDVDSFQKLVTWHEKMGTDGLVLCGSTGEGALLSHKEKLTLFRAAKEVVGSEIFLIGNTGVASTYESVDLTEASMSIGLDACIAVVPYYVRPTRSGCLQHFSAISNVGLPTVVYHHPIRTGTQLDLSTLVEICNLPNIAGLKEACSDFELAYQLRQSLSIPLYSGDDLFSLAHFLAGFDGSISVLGNIVPKSWKTYVECARRGDFKKARELFGHLYPLCKAIFQETNPQGVKYALSEMSRCDLYLRPPLLPPNEENQKAIRENLPIVESALR